ncbi:hypothetical protein BB560_000368 [Smittium megazygosporum]|uniref:Uncharacterized protein n=1 Tax=Smittium megazygosporum TaxID=133381 RepID=A0A2T9ZKK8_9FUNG|nr:hypothetical protein BB560_000368 [Smittium megazygosporum]
MSSPTSIALFSKGVNFSKMRITRQSKIASKFLEYAKNVSLNGTAGLFEYILIKSRKNCQITKNWTKVQYSGPRGRLALPKRPSKIIDVCNVCVFGNQYKVKLDSMLRSRNIDILSMLSYVPARNQISRTLVFILRGVRVETDSVLLSQLGKQTQIVHKNVVPNKIVA